MFYRSSPKVTKHLGYLCDETYAQEIKKITQSGHIDLDRSAAHVIGKALMAIKWVSVASVTIWIDFYTIFGHLQQIRFSPINIFFKSRSIILKNTKKTLKYCKILLKVCQKCQNFAKCGHTVCSILYQVSGPLETGLIANGRIYSFFLFGRILGLFFFTFVFSIHS